MIEPDSVSTLRVTSACSESDDVNEAALELTSGLVVAVTVDSDLNLNASNLGTFDNSIFSLATLSFYSARLFAPFGLRDDMVKAT